MKRKPWLFSVIAVILVLLLAGGLYWWANQPKEASKTTVPPPAQNSTNPPQPSPVEPAQFDKTTHSTTDPASIWVVVNKQNPLNPKSYAPSDLTAVGNGQFMRSEAAQAIAGFISAAQAAGHAISPASAYRSYQTQVTVYNNEVAAYGQTVADTESARPGFSEHQTGLSIDIAGGGCSIEDCFANTAEGKWAAAYAAEHGFILRYPEGKQSVTGYRYEPWHFRYVGKDLAVEMKHKAVLTLEEFFGLPAAPSY